MTQQQNPLSSYFRAPKLYCPIPSRGKFYGDDVLEMPETGELPIYPMTAKDEMLMKNPDALLNGESVATVIQSCVPCVKDARKMLSSDIDVLLVAIQGATHGDKVDVTAKCPKCDEEVTGQASVEAAITTMELLKDSYIIDFNNLKIEIRPFTYESTISAGITNFKSTRSLQALADVDDEMERLRLFNQNFQQIAELNFQLMVDSIASITFKDENGDPSIVTDRKHILEFLVNTEASIGKLIEDKIKEINNIGIDHSTKMQCSNEDCVDENGDRTVFDGQVNFDPVTFFTAS